MVYSWHIPKAKIIPETGFIWGVTNAGEVLVLLIILIANNYHYHSEKKCYQKKEQFPPMY